ncbi:MAG: hypothetical protein K2W82_18330, partial [Candidatus Obscuribacterales bacterium]|nr:hypothetical protein [Candidatus Obscuribacterales bacterium]
MATKDQPEIEKKKNGQTPSDQATGAVAENTDATGAKTKLISDAQLSSPGTVLGEANPQQVFAPPGTLTTLPGTLAPTTLEITPVAAKESIVGGITDRALNPHKLADELISADSDNFGTKLTLGTAAVLGGSLLLKKSPGLKQIGKMVGSEAKEAAILSRIAKTESIAAQTAKLATTQEGRLGGRLQSLTVEGRSLATTVDGLTTRPAPPPLSTQFLKAGTDGATLTPIGKTGTQLSRPPGAPFSLDVPQLPGTKAKLGEPASLYKPPVIEAPRTVTTVPDSLNPRTISIDAKAPRSGPAKPGTPHIDAITLPKTKTAEPVRPTPTRVEVPAKPASPAATTKPVETVKPASPAATTKP